MTKRPPRIIAKVRDKTWLDKYQPAPASAPDGKCPHCKASVLVAGPYHVSHHTLSKEPDRIVTFECGFEAFAHSGVTLSMCMSKYILGEKRAHVFLPWEGNMVGA